MATLLLSAPACAGCSTYSSRREPVSARFQRAVRCEAEPTGRRSALQLLTSLPLLAATPALARVERDISDDRKAVGAFRSMDQARDTDEKQQNRFSMTEAAGMTPEMHKKRITESLARLEKQVKADIAKKHWPRVSSDLRGQMSTLRFDLDALNAAKPDKAARKAAQKAQDAAMKALEQLDYLARTRNGEEIGAAYQTAFAQLEKVVSSLG